MKMPGNLSPRARGVLERYRAADAMTPHERQRLLDTVQRRAARGDVPVVDAHGDLDFGRGAPSRSVARPVRAWWTRATVGKGAAILGASGLALTAWLGVHRPAAAPVTASLALSPAAAPAAPADPASAPPAPPAETLVPASPAPTLLAPVPAPSDARPASAKPGTGGALGARRPAPAPLPPPENSAPAAPESTIDAEVRLIAEAQSAQGAGNPRRALQLLDEHAARFPTGKLADARAVARMIALCSSGQRAVARAEARSFLQRYPHSPFAGRVANICGQDDDPARR